MHLADLDGRIYERNKRQSHRLFVFSATCAAVIVAVITLVLFWQ